MRAATRTFGTAFVLLLALTGCSDLDIEVPAPSETTRAAPPTPTGSLSTSPPPASAVVPSCEQLMPPTSRGIMQSSGYEPTASAFLIGDLTLDPGIQCMWMIPGSPTDAHVLQAWGEITKGDAQIAIDALVGEGWVTEPGDDGTYVTYPNGGVQSDADGYFTTYLFGDGWVTLSDVKAGLAEIVRPGAS